MHVFLDFEASSLSKQSYPVEVAWVFEDGRSEEHLIRPAPGWTEWDGKAESIHGLSRARLESEGTPHWDVARRMIETLCGHDLLASAPSWDGKWLSVLLRAAGLPRHSLRLRSSYDAQAEVARDRLAPCVDPCRLDEAVAELVRCVCERGRERPTAHRALADAEAERRRWLEVAAAAEARAADLRATGRLQTA